MTTLQAIPRANPDFTVRDIGEEMIFISSKGDVLHTIDPVGAFIWKNVNGERSVRDILAMLLQAYDVSSAAAQQDILRFFEELGQKEIVQIA